MRTRPTWPAGLALLALVAAGCRTDQPPAPSSAAATGSDRPVAAAPRFGEPTVLGHLQDPAIGESSGLVAARANPGLLWTHNDSGDGPFAYCLRPTGASCGTWRVTGAEARDWEDAAAGPGPDPARSYLYFGDIGDNDRKRAEVIVYRVAEPAVPAEGAVGPDAPRATEPAEVLQLRYPDGAHDAEALLVHPTSGDLYVVSKGTSTTPAVYKAAAPLRPGRAQEMTRIPGLRLPGFTARLELVTGGDISPDGRRVVLSTYAAGYELELPAGEAAAFDDIWRRPAASIELAPRRQGEAITYRLDGAAVLTTSEGVGEAITQVERRPPA